MKRLFSILLSVTMLLMMLPVTAMAADSAVVPDGVAAVSAAEISKAEKPAIIKPIPKEKPLPGTSYSDVPARAYYAHAVAWAVGCGITNGMGGGRFAPFASCSRAQAVTLLYRAAGSPEVSSGVYFTDVDVNAYYADAVVWAAEQGITNGMGDGLFAPNAACTRAQLATMLFRAVGSPVSGASGFDDIDDEAWYADAVIWAATQGITADIDDDSFAPGMSCTRGMAISFIWRCFT